MQGVTDDNPIEHFCSLIKVNAEKRQTLTPFLIPEEVDLQGDIISEDEIMEAVHDMAKRGLTTQGGLLDFMHFHVDDKVGIPLEIYVMPCDGIIGGIKVTKGTAMARIEWSEAAWLEIKDGKMTGLSIEGNGVRHKVII